MKKTGGIILAIGLLITIFAGFNFITREKVVDLGSVEIMQNKNHRLTWSPVIGIVMIAIGGGIYLFGAKEK